MVIGLTSGMQYHYTPLSCWGQNGFHYISFPPASTCVASGQVGASREPRRTSVSVTYELPAQKCLSHGGINKLQECIKQCRCQCMLMERAAHRPRCMQISLRSGRPLHSELLHSHTNVHTHAHTHTHNSLQCHLIPSFVNWCSLQSVKLISVYCKHLLLSGLFYCSTNM